MIGKNEPQKIFLYLLLRRSAQRIHTQILLRGAVVQAYRKTAPGLVAPGLFSG